jgi:hypothetical protein
MGSYRFGPSWKDVEHMGRSVVEVQVAQPAPDWQEQLGMFPRIEFCIQAQVLELFSIL